MSDMDPFDGIESQYRGYLRGVAAKEKVEAAQRLANNDPLRAIAGDTTVRLTAEEIRQLDEFHKNRRSMDEAKKVAYQPTLLDQARVAAQGNINNNAQGIIDPRWFSGGQQYDGKGGYLPAKPLTKWIYADGPHKRAVDASKLETLYIHNKGWKNWAIIGTIGSADIHISSHPNEKEAEAALTTLLQSL